MTTTRNQHRSSGIIRLGIRKRAVGLGLGVVAMLLRGFGMARQVLHSKPSAGRVVILEPFGMGDLISHQPLVHALRENAYDVCICARPEWRALYPEVSCWVPARLPWSSYEEGKKYSLAQYMSGSFRDIVCRLRQVGAGRVGIDTRGDIRSVILLYLAGCRQVLTLSNYLSSDLENFRGAARRVMFCSRSRRWEINLSFLEALGLKPKSETGPPQFSHLARSRTPLSAHRLGLLPIAPWKGRFWGRENWSELISSATAEGWNITGLCGPGQSIAAGEELGGAVRVLECASLEAWAVELQRLSAIITLDTGPMHLADALRVPLVALFGPGQLPLWAPSGHASRVVSHQNDADFFMFHQIEKNIPLGRKFMSRIQPAEVLAALRKVE